MSHRYIVLGAGMQGTAAAYDLAKFAVAEKITVADMDLSRAEAACKRVNQQLGKDRCLPRQVDVTNPNSLESVLTEADVLLSCVPYWMHPQIAASAIQTATHMCDLGGNTDVTWETLALDAKAKTVGVTLVPDCGLAPGLVNSLGMFLIEKMDDPESIRLFCGVLPQHPVPPFNYKLTFNIEGLVTEYDYEAIALRNGDIVHLETLSELETIYIEELGVMEAFTTSGGTSTAPYTLKGRLKDYEYKTIRFPGHCERMRIFKDFGFWSEQEVVIRGVGVRPKDLFCKVFGKSLSQIQDSDQCAIRAIGEGFRDGKEVSMEIDLFDRQCEETGFTSMERLTGFPLSIMAQHIASGEIESGCIRYEKAMTGAQMVSQLGLRGIGYRFQES